MEMIVTGPKKNKSSKRTKTSTQLAKDTLKKAIANGTLKELLWGERTDDDKSNKIIAPTDSTEDPATTTSNQKIDDNSPEVDGDGDEAQDKRDETDQWNRMLNRRTQIAGPVVVGSENGIKKDEILARKPVVPVRSEQKASLRTKQVKDAAKRANNVLAIAKKSGDRKEAPEPITGEYREDNVKIDKSRRETYAGILSKPKRYLDIMRELKQAALELEAAKEEAIRAANEAERSGEDTTGDSDSEENEGRGSEAVSDIGGGRKRSTAEGGDGGGEGGEDGTDAFDITGGDLKKITEV